MKSLWRMCASFAQYHIVIATATRWMRRSWLALQDSTQGSFGRSLVTVAQQEALTLVRARNLIVRLRTAAVNAVRGQAKPRGYRLPASSTLCFAKRCAAVLPPGEWGEMGGIMRGVHRAIATISAGIKGRHTYCSNSGG
jgi:hypothetical protein